MNYPLTSTNLTNIAFCKHDSSKPCCKCLSKNEGGICDRQRLRNAVRQPTPAGNRKRFSVTAGYAD